MRSAACKSSILLVVCLVVSGVWLGACSDTVNRPCLCAPADVCATDSECGGGASCTDGCCGGCKACLLDADCNDPGKKCQDGQCVDKVQCAPELACTTAGDCAGNCMACVDRCCVSAECASDADCPPEGGLQRFCPPEPDPITGCRVCNYVRCVTDEECSDPTFPLYQVCTPPLFPKCSRGTCECAQPCGGQCPDGKYCCKSTNLCEDIPVACEGTQCPACEMVNPEPGGTLDDEACRIEGADCSCQPLPPLPDAFQGQHSAIALLPDGVPVLSGYYAEPYGDLLFGVASGVEAGASVSWTLVDGLPADAPCEGAALGPRGGIAQPGDDVGQDTDIAVAPDGTARIAYFDVTHGALKFAVQGPGGWAVHTVDDGGLTGRYSSLRIGPDERPLIAYLQVAAGNTSALRVAWADLPEPTSEADWTLYTVDSLTVACLPDSCAQGEVCLGDTGGCEPRDDPGNCSPGCSAQQACVAGACRPLGTRPVLVDLPRGVGLFASLDLLSDGSPVVAYYDSVNGALKLAAWDPGAGSFGAPVVLDGSGAPDLGVDCDLAVAADDSLHVVYQDAQLGQLRYLRPGAGGVELVDVGARDENGLPTDLAGAVGELHWVGNFARVLVDAAGNVRVAYQDGTSLDLVVAVRSPAGVWNLSLLARRGEGASFTGNWGFFVDQALDASGQVVHISNFKHNLRTDPWSSAIDLRVHQVP